MPQTDMGALLFIGTIFFLIGLLGGGFEISAIKIPPVGKYPRYLSLGIGAIFMGIAVIRLIFPPVPLQPGVTPTATTPASTMVIAEAKPTESTQQPEPTATPVTSTDTPIPVSTDTSTPQPTNTPTPAHTPLIINDDNCQNTTFRTEDLGLWVWGQARPPMPTPASLCEVIFAHGDIDDSGTCHVKEFKTGEIIQGLGNGTFRLLRISGNPNQIKTEEVQRQQTAAAEANGSCPWLTLQTLEVEQSTPTRVLPTPVPTSTPPPPGPCPDYIPRNQIQVWNLGATGDSKVVDAKVEEFNSYRKYQIAPYGNLKRGDLVPVGVILAISFDPVGMSYTQFPVKPLVYYNNYGLFETTGEFIAPYEGACISIGP